MANSKGSSTATNYEGLTCPRSLSRVDGKIMKPHPLTVRLCRGDKPSLFYYCNIHGIRGFCSDPEEYKRCIDAQKRQVQQEA